MKRFVLIGFIWLGCTVAWMILGATINFRTGESSGDLLEEVHALWGPPLEQFPPTASWQRTKKVTEAVTQYAPNGTPFTAGTVQRDEIEEVPLVLAGTDAKVKLELEQRRKGLLWFPTYGVDFQARYRFTNPDKVAHTARVTFPIARSSAALDGFEVVGEDGQPVGYEISQQGATWEQPFEPGQTRAFDVRFRTRGTSRWTYRLADGTSEVRDFRLALGTNFGEVDFPAGSLSPTRHTGTGRSGGSGGDWSGEWQFRTLISGAPIGVDLPQLLNPGVVASRITFFAPVGLLFFFFVVSILAVAQKKDLHPANYFFFGTAFFAFHLLFAYLVDHVALAPAFALSSAVAVFLIVSYARLFAGWRFSLRELALSQLLYLVLFSFTFFWNGFTGLAITVGAIVTLFAMMQVTGRLKLQATAPTPPPIPPAAGPRAGTAVERMPGIAEAFASPAVTPPPETRI